MKACKAKIDLALAKSMQSPYSLCRSNGIPVKTFYRVYGESDCRPATIGRIAAALKVPIEALVLIESGDKG